MSEACRCEIAFYRPNTNAHTYTNIQQSDGSSKVAFVSDLIWLMCVSYAEHERDGHQSEKFLDLSYKYFYTLHNHGLDHLVRVLVLLAARTSCGFPPPPEATTSRMSRSTPCSARAAPWRGTPAVPAASSTRSAASAPTSRWAPGPCDCHDEAGKQSLARRLARRQLGVAGSKRQRLACEPQRRISRVGSRDESQQILIQNQA